MVSHQDLIREARREIRALKPRRGVRKDAWGNVVDLLCALAGYLPDCWPSERTLANKLGRHQPAVHRTLVQARALGLLTTTPRPLEHSWRDGQSYHLACLSEPLREALSRYHFQITLGIRSKSSSSKKTDTGTPSGFPQGRAAPGQQEPPMPRPTDDESNPRSWGPAYGEDPRAPLVEPTEIKGPDPAIYLARRFDVRWGRMIRAHPELSDVRGSSRGAAIGYLRDVMLPQVASPEHAEAYIDAFIHAAADGDIEFRDGQHAWQRFTGWWGKVPLEDPRIKAEQRAASQAMIDEYHRQSRA